MYNFIINMKHVITSFFENICSSSIVRVPVLKLLCTLYRPVVRKELAKAGVSPWERVLFIGGGALPYSAVLMHELTGSRVDVLDNDYQAFQNALCLSQTCVPEACTPFFKCGTECDPKNYDVIVIARQVDNKEQVLAHINQTAADDTRVLIREKGQKSVIQNREDLAWL